MNKSFHLTSTEHVVTGGAESAAGSDLVTGVFCIEMNEMFVINIINPPSVLHLGRI